VPRVRRDPPNPSPLRPDLATRLRVIEESGPATQARLEEIITMGGPMPDTKGGAKVVGAAIIDVDDYQGPREMRAINGTDTDALGQSAPVYHAKTPTNRTLSATQGERTPSGGRRASTTGPRKESIFPHLNDVEMKLFEDIISRLPKGARGTIYFTTVRVRQVNGQTVIEAYPACSGCIRASFETAGMLPGVDLVSHAPTHAAGHDPFTGHPAGGDEHGEPGSESGGAAPKTTVPPKAAEPVKEPHAAKTTEPSTPDVPVTGAATAKTTEPATTNVPAQTNVPVKGPATATTTEPATTTAPARASGARVPHVAIAIGTGIASLGLGWLAAYLKSRVDQRVAQRQIDAFLNLAEKRINANPDKALKQMMINPETTVYAWVYLTNAVNTTVTVDSSSIDPTTSDSAPMIDLSTIDYMPIPMDQSLLESFPTISAGAHRVTTVRTITIDIPLETPPIEDMIDYAQGHNLPLDDLFNYALGKYQSALASNETVLAAHVTTLNAYQTTLDAYHQLQAALQVAQKRHDFRLQRSITDKLLTVASSLKSIASQFEPLRVDIQKSDDKAKYWKHIVDLTKPAAIGR